MHDSLMAIKNKYVELNDFLQQPEITSDIKKYTKISREANSITKIVEAFDKFLKIENALLEAKQMLQIETDGELIEMAKAEIEAANIALPKLEEELKLLLLPQDPNDDKAVIMEIRGAAGGDEANIFAGDLYDVYKK